jgi:ubiquinone/menaquinone biosynthesis C-methylase UbiE
MLMMGDHLHALLAPTPGERLLEVGAGSGMYALEVADAVLPGGSIAMVDDQPRMLEVAMARARDRGLGNVTAVFADVRYLPFEDRSFDAAYLIAALGGVTGPEAAVLEIARVLRSGGRVVVGELHDDPHMVGPARLRTMAASAGFRISHRVNADCGYLAELQSPGRADLAA